MNERQVHTACALKMWVCWAATGAVQARRAKSGAQGAPGGPAPHQGGHRARPQQVFGGNPLCLIRMHLAQALTQSALHVGEVRALGRQPVSCSLQYCHRYKRPNSWASPLLMHRMSGPGFYSAFLPDCFRCLGVPASLILFLLHGTDSNLQVPLLNTAESRYILWAALMDIPNSMTALPTTRGDGKFSGKYIRENVEK
jgi:hypothetical protein